MKTHRPVPLAPNAILVLAEIKAATESFDRGETNMFDALDAILVAIEAYRTACRNGREAA